MLARFLEWRRVRRERALIWQMALEIARGGQWNPTQAVQMAAEQRRHLHELKITWILEDGSREVRHG